MNLIDVSMRHVSRCERLAEVNKDVSDNSVSYVSYQLSQWLPLSRAEGQWMLPYGYSTYRRAFKRCM